MGSLGSRYKRSRNPEKCPVHLRRLPQLHLLSAQNKTLPSSSLVFNSSFLSSPELVLRGGEGGLKD